MKKIFVLFTFMSLVSFAVNAQTCPHAKKSNASTSVQSADYAKTVAAAAEMDESIEQKVCAKSGTVSYERKSVCAASGKVSYTPVEYDAATAKFVNVSPSDAAAAEKKACCASGSKKACCAGGSAKSCTKAKSSGASSAAPASDGKVKMVKSEQ